MTIPLLTPLAYFRIAVVMLGRLGMSTSRAIEAHRRLSDVFSDRKLITRGTHLFKASRLESTLKAMVKEATGNSEEQMLDQRADGEHCKTCAFILQSASCYLYTP